MTTPGTVPTISWPSHVLEAEEKRLADLAAFFDVPGYTPLGGPHDDDPFALIPGSDDK